MDGALQFDNLTQKKEIKTMNQENESQILELMDLDIEELRELYLELVYQVRDLAPEYLSDLDIAA